MDRPHIGTLVTEWQDKLLQVPVSSTVKSKETAAVRLSRLRRLEKGWQNRYRLTQCHAAGDMSTGLDAREEGSEASAYMLEGEAITFRVQNGAGHQVWIAEVAEIEDEAIVLADTGQEPWPADIDPRCEGLTQSGRNNINPPNHHAITGLRDVFGFPQAQHSKIGAMIG